MSKIIVLPNRYYHTKNQNLSVLINVTRSKILFKLKYFMWKSSINRSGLMRLRLAGVKLTLLTTLITFKSYVVKIFNSF